MGERAQVKVIGGQHDGPAVYLYTHWGAHELPGQVASALERGRDRWDDIEYLTRIIFNEMTRGEELGTTGFGIGTKEHFDNNYPPIIVDVAHGLITHAGTTSSFEAFVSYQLGLPA